ncbi:MAG: hypothetical protein GY816_13780, partial [Cytophagales bacterium]|nr:hypothetical protein [Cytophagales bacterium]
VLVGDLNLPGIDWDRVLSLNPVEQLFLDTLSDMSLCQVINEPTHIKGNVLDLICSDRPEHISEIIVDSKHGLSGSDHYAISFKLELYARRKKPCKRKIYNFKRANWEGLNEDFHSVDWNNLFRNCSVDLAWSKFKTKFDQLCDKNIPKISISDEFQPPWFDSEVYNLCRKKERLHKDWKGSDNDT